MIRTVTIDGGAIHDWQHFHDVFAEVFGFPKWYGKNLDAWIDCMSSLDDPEMTSFVLARGEMVLLHLKQAKALRAAAPEILTALLELSAFCNWRRVEAGRPPILILSCNT